MSDVTQDAEHAEWLYNNLPVRVPSWNAIGPEARAAMAHNVERVRIAVEKAVLDRLRDLPGDTVEDVMNMVNELFEWEMMSEEVTGFAAALADALEAKP